MLVLFSDLKRVVAAISALAATVAATAAAAPVAIAQDRPFWDSGDRYGEQPAPRRAAPRDGTYQADQAPGPGGGGQPYDPSYGTQGYGTQGNGAPASGANAYGAQAYGTQNYEPRRPAFGAPPAGQQPGQGYANDYSGANRAGPPPGSNPGGTDAYSPPGQPPAWGDGYRTSAPNQFGRSAEYQGAGPSTGGPGAGSPNNGGRGGYSAPPAGPAYGEPYAPPPERYDDRGYDERRGGPPDGPRGGTYSRNEVLDTGHRFFGSVSQGLASAVEWAFQQAGRPNGYILGEDAGGAFIAGLRYGEGVLYTKDVGRHRVYWQGPSVGYDFGGEGSKAMVLVYNLRDPSEIYSRFGGVQGAAYLVGGVSVQLQKDGDVTLAVIRSGVGLRLGANVGYLKYTRSPTWNPF